MNYDLLDIGAMILGCSLVLIALYFLLPDRQPQRRSGR
jgi:hypothetical protein